MIETRQLRVAMQRGGIRESYLFAKFEKGKGKEVTFQGITSRWLT